MTFYEAALEVLRRSGRPLHYKKITEIAIRDNLLSHVGKTPEVTMSARLNQEVKRQDFAALEKKRPGVFCLRDEVAKKLNEEYEEKRHEMEEAQAKRDAEAAARAEEVRQDAKELEEGGAQDERSERSDNSDDANNGRRRRRRRGNRTRHRRDEEDSPSSKERRDEKPERSERSERSERRSSGRRNGSSKEQRDSKPRRQRPARSSANKPSSVDQLDGIARAAYTVLRDQKGEALPVKALADEIFERKLAKFHTHDASATVQAALVNDNLTSTRAGKRALFSTHNNNRWGLSEWGLSSEGLEKEAQINELAQECLKDAESLLAKTLPKLAPESLEQMILVVLEKLGYTQIKVSKRGSNGDVYFSAQWRRGLSEVRTCIQLTADRQRAIGSEDITELRGTLHHYSASEGVIIHLGEITRDAANESRQERLAPLTLIDQSALIKLLVQHNLGIRAHQVPVYTVDTAYFDALGVDA